MGLVQALPLPLLLITAYIVGAGNHTLSLIALLGINLFLVLLRWGMLIAIASSYAGFSLFFWLSPLADILAVARIFLSSLSKPKRWRGRVYQ